MKTKRGKERLWPKDILVSKNNNIYVRFHCFLIIVLFFARYGDCYVWNKVTTCIHNILSGRRWIEHYGEVTIRNTKSSVCICKLTFVKVNNDFHSKEKVTWYSSSEEEINQLHSTASSKVCPLSLILKNISGRKAEPKPTDGFPQGGQTSECVEAKKGTISKQGGKNSS